MIRRSDSLHTVWEHEFHDTEFDWAQVQSRLLEAASPIRVVEVNSQSPGTLDYSGNRQDGLNVVAVGGFSLSRGLTLEGLMVSYFLRNSMMYDTLMQMGRWFGYRPDYQDLCRIWMPDAAQGWYEHIAESIEELRSELRGMEASNATPEDFGLKVRSHPGFPDRHSTQQDGIRVFYSGEHRSRIQPDRDPYATQRRRELGDQPECRSSGSPVGWGRLGFPIETAESVEFGLPPEGSSGGSDLGLPHRISKSPRLAEKPMGGRSDDT